MHRALANVALLGAFTACGGPTSARPPEPASGPELSPARAPIAWMTGDWSHDGGVEHWVAAAGVLYGVDFHADGSYELMIVDDAEQGAEGKPDGTLRLYAMPGGALPTLFTGASDAPKQVQFANPSHDDATAIGYAVASTGLHATVTGPGGDHVIAMPPGAAATAPEAEAADVAFAHDTDADGVEGWDRHFADDGAMLRGDKRIEGHDAIRAAMAPLLGSASLVTGSSRCWAGRGRWCRRR